MTSEGWHVRQPEVGLMVKWTQLYCATCVREWLGDELFADRSCTEIGYLGLSMHGTELPFYPPDVHVHRCDAHGPLMVKDIHFVKERWQDVLV